MVRLNKAMSMLGICSRRDADFYINEGKIKVNGSLVKEVGVKVSGGDVIGFAGKNFKFQEEMEHKVWLYYKPVGLVTTHSDEKNRETVFDDLREKIKERVISVGRLDLNSEGLLLLTNSGDFARFAESPKTGWERHYKVRVFGVPDQDMLRKLEGGMIIDGFKYAPMTIKSVDKMVSRNCWIDCILREGKNREIRNLFEHFGLQVSRLIRYKYGPYDLKDMKPGEVVEGDDYRF